MSGVESKRFSPLTAFLKRKINFRIKALFLLTKKQISVIIFCVECDEVGDVVEAHPVGEEARQKEWQPSQRASESVARSGNGNRKRSGQLQKTN